MVLPFLCFINKAIQRPLLILLFALCLSSPAHSGFNCRVALNAGLTTLKQGIANKWHSIFPRAPVELSMDYGEAQSLYRELTDTSLNAHLLPDQPHERTTPPKPNEARSIRDAQEETSNDYKNKILSLSLLTERLEKNATPGIVQSSLKKSHQKFREWWNQNYRKYTDESALRSFALSGKSLGDIYQIAHSDYLIKSDPRFSEAVNLPPSLRRPVEFIGHMIHKPIRLVGIGLVGAIALSAGPQIGQKVLAPVAGELDRISSDWTSSYQVKFSKLVNSLTNKEDVSKRVGETGNKMIDLLTHSAGMDPQDVAKQLDDFNQMYAASRVLTPAALRGDQVDGRNVSTWVGINFASSYTGTLSHYDDIIQRDRDAILANKNEIDKIYAAWPSIKKASSVSDLKTDQEKILYEITNRSKQRIEELEKHLHRTKKQLAGTLVSWQITEFMYGELFYSKSPNTAAGLYRKFLTQYDMIDYMKEYKDEFDAAVKGVVVFFKSGKVSAALFKHMPSEMQKQLVLEDAEMRRKGEANLSLFSEAPDEYYKQAIETTNNSALNTSAAMLTERPLPTNNQ